MAFFKRSPKPSTPPTQEEAAAALLSAPNSFLRTIGWHESVRVGMPVSADGTPLPWFTYPLIAFLTPRVRPEMRVFEYGSGNSTLWWSGRVAKVVSCEHDRQWADRMRPVLPAGVDYRHFDLVPGGDYCREILRHEAEFDIVVIDGRDRVNCARNCLGALKPAGVVIWDNSDRASYAEGYEFLLSAGFKRLDFWGMGPINGYAWCTSVFYRPGNCLDL